MPGLRSAVSRPARVEGFSMEGLVRATITQFFGAPKAGRVSDCSREMFSSEQCV